MNVDDELKYSYSSKPRAVQTNRAKSAHKILPPNIMHDPRIVRGSMFATGHNQSAPTHRSDDRERAKKRRSSSSSSKSKVATKSIFEAQRVASYTFTPFSLEANLVEQLPVVPERDSSSQTDAFTTRIAPKPKGMNVDGAFLRPKVGVDSATQIEDTDKLFNFDVEVRPLLNVLVSKTIAQALAEVKEELELRGIESDRKALLVAKADAARADRELEVSAKAAQRAKDDALRAKELAGQRRRVMTEKVCAWQLAHALVPQVFARATAALEAAGVFYDPLHRDLQQWLAADVFADADAKVQLRRVAARLLDDLVANSIRRQTILSQLLGSEDDAMVRLILRDPLQGPTAAAAYADDAVNASEAAADSNRGSISVIGPIALSRHDSLDTIEHKIQLWIAEHVGDDVAVPLGGFLSALNLTGDAR